jgi:carbohydrate kinase (thermoresistant glucokinase family)
MVIVVIGPMGCGKTTIGSLLAQKLNWKFSDGDDFHPPENVEKMRNGIALEDKDRLGWLEALRDHIKEQHELNSDLVLACSALKQSYRDLLGIDQKSVVSVYLNGSEELLRERISRRTHQYMNDSLLTSQLQTMEKPEDGITVAIDQTPEEICSDIIRQVGSI